MITLAPARHGRMCRVAVRAASAVALVVLSGCGLPPNRVAYEVSDIESMGSGSPHASLYVAPVVDKRTPWRGDWFDLDRESCHNNRYHGGSDSVVAEMTRCLAAHLSKAGLFDTVTCSPGDSAELVLKVAISRLDGSQRIPEDARALTGVAARALAALIRTQAGMVIAFTDVEVRRTSDGELLVSIPSFERHYSEEVPADKYCVEIYRHVNEKLKQTVDALAREIDARLREPVRYPVPLEAPQGGSVPCVIVSKTGASRKGFLASVTDTVITYSVEAYGPLVEVQSRNVRFVVTGTDTVFRAEER